LLKYQEIEDDQIFKEKYKTDYCVSWLPLGGYCKINGMIDESFDAESMKEGPPMPWEYRAKPIWQRTVAILGGIIFNFVLAVLIYFTIALRQGVPDVDKFNEYKLGTQISGVNEGSPASAAGLLAGDRIVRIDGREVTDWREIVDIVKAKPGSPIMVEWVRGEVDMKAEITPLRLRTQTSEGIQDIGQIGIAAPVHPDFVKEASLADAAGYGLANTFFVTRLILTNLKQIFTGEVSFRETMGGPVAIVKMTGQVKKQQGWEGILGFMALLSISLAVFNLFPIPALDGGHFLMLMVEGIIRRPLSVKFKLYAQQVGMALLLTFIAYVTFNDLTR
ncbi:MAG: RIP metalloprotease RseP, partial [Bacteroidetes bacterium]|nr:RIP metalloprotease RseP [Bacteroidota bacterium]